MRRAGDLSGSVWLALLAFAGLLAGHFFSYVVVAPHDHQRAELLRTTGHGAPDLFAPLAIAALVAAAIGFIGLHLRRPPTGGRTGGKGRIALFLWVAQTAGFVALEAGERALSSHPVAELVAEPAFLVGLVAQLLVALAGALLLVALHRTVEAIRGLFASIPPAAPAVEHFSVAPSNPRSLLRHYAWSLRGPPAS